MIFMVTYNKNVGHLIKKEKECLQLGAVLIISGLVTLALFIYLFYILFRGEKL